MSKKIVKFGVLFFSFCCILTSFLFINSSKIGKNNLNFKLPFTSQSVKNNSSSKKTSDSQHFEVSLLLCQNKLKKPTNNVVLIMGKSFSYSSYATSLATALDAPILLDEHNNLSAYTKEQMIKLKPKNVLVVGHVGAVTEYIRNEIQELSANVIDCGGQYIVPSNVLNDLPADVNAKNPLKTPTYDGSGQACHPKVIYFPNSWNGWKYWMVMTPYPNTNEYFENPSILVSDSGMSWQIPKGIINPVIPGMYKYGIYNSDPHLVFNDKSNELELWYRYTVDSRANVNDKSDKIYKITSKDGAHWTSPKMLLTFSNKEQCLSPAVLYENNKYKMWYIDQNSQCIYTESEDGTKWSEKQKVNLHLPGTYLPWHIDMVHTDRGYEAIFCATNDGANSIVLFANTSNDGLNFNDSVAIVKPSKNQNAWDNKYIYRSTVVKINGIYKLYYSAMDKNHKWHIGLATGNELTNLHGVDGELK